MKIFEHENVMKVIGVSLDNQLCPEIILPLMSKGDLLTYVRKEANVVTYKHVSRFQINLFTILIMTFSGYKIWPRCRSWNGIFVFEKCYSS